jgi:hypothetical protein
MKFKMEKTGYVKFKTQKHMIQELVDGKCFANCYGDVIRYDESFPDSPFRISQYTNMNESVPMTSGWNKADQKIWVEIPSYSSTDEDKSSDTIEVYTINIVTDKGEFDKFILEEGVELEFNHADNTLYFRPATENKPKSTKTVYEWLYKTKFTRDWEISPVLKSEEEAKDFFDRCEYKKTGRSWEVEV